MSNNVNSYDYLYYPYINFRDDTWLKKMVLYADSVARIVPHRYPTRHTEMVDLLTKENIIQDYAPYEGGENPAKLFSHFITKFKDDLLPIYAVDKQDNWYSDVEDAHVRREFDTARAYVEATKLDGADLNTMLETELVVQGRNDDINWLGMHPRLANTFMTLLMNGIVANNPHLQPVADFSSNAVDIHIDNEEDLVRTLIESPHIIKKTDAKDAFVTFAFEQVLPANLEELNINEILELRQKYPHELRRFQDAASEFAKKHRSLEDIKKPERMLGYLSKQYNKEVTPAIEGLKSAFKKQKLEYVVSAVSISAAPPGILTAVGVAFNPILATIAGGALAVAQIVKMQKENKESAIKSCDYSWLYRVENEITPKEVLDEIDKRAWKLWGN